MSKQTAPQTRGFAPFSKAALDYSALDLSVIPCMGEDGKHPLVKWRQWQTKSPPKALIEKWMEQHPAANIGIITGEASGITVLDCDDTSVGLHELFSQYGETPLVVQTPSGGYHLYYRHQQEHCGQHIAPGIDIRGTGGFVVAPPSINPVIGKIYQFIEGDMKWLEALPHMNTLELESIPPCPTPAPSPALITMGQRNKALFTHLKEVAAKYDSIDQLMEAGLEYNKSTLRPELSEDEIISTAKSVWKYKEKGLLLIKGQHNILLPYHRVQEVLFAHPYANSLYTDLLACHKGCRIKFAISPKAYCRRAGWDAQTVRNAIQVLLKTNLIERVQHGGKSPGNANLYRLT